MAANAVFWNKLADRYAAQPVGDPDAFERKIAVTKGLMSPSDTLLEIGCGTGSLAVRLAPCAGEIHGLDVSAEMIRHAEAKAVTNTSFHVGAFDSSFDLFGPDSIDGVCAYSILHLLENREDALRRIYRLLKPGGFFVSSTVTLGESWVPYRPLLWAMRMVGKAPMVSIFNKRRLTKDFEAAGFTDIEEPEVGAGKVVTFLVARKPT